MEQINNNKYTRIHLPSAYESIRSTNDEIKSGLICRQNGKRLLCLQEPRMSAPVKNNSRNDLLNSKTTHFGNLEHDLLGKTSLPVQLGHPSKGTALISSALKQQSLLLSGSGHAVPTLQCLHAGWLRLRLQQQNHGTTSPFTPANEGNNERWLRNKRRVHLPAASMSMPRCLG